MSITNSILLLLLVIVHKFITICADLQESKWSRFCDTSVAKDCLKCEESSLQGSLRKDCLENVTAFLLMLFACLTVHCDRDHFPNGASCTLSDGIMSCVILEGLVSQVCNLPMQGSANGMCGNLLLRTVAIVPASILTTSRAQAAGLTEADLSHPGNFLCMHVRLAKFFAQGRVCLVPEWDPDTGRLRKPIQVRFWVWDRVLRRSHIALDPDCLPGEEWFVLDGERRPVLLENLHGKVLKIKPDQLTITLLGIHCWFAFRNALHRGRELPRFSMRLGLFSKDFAAPNEMFFEDIRTICEEQLAVGLSQRKAHAGLFAILDVAGTFDILESKRI